MSKSFEELRGEFLAETSDTLAQLQRDLNQFAEREPSSDLVDRVFRTTHSLKGVAGMLGLDDISTVSHALENVLEGMRGGRLHLDSEWMELLFRGNQILHALFDAANGIDHDFVDVDAFRADVDQRLRQDSDVESQLEVRLRGYLERLSPTEREAVRKADRAGATIAVVEKVLPLDTFDAEFDTLVELVQSWGVVHGFVSDEETDEGFRIRVVASSDHDFFSLLKLVRPAGADASSVHAPASSERHESPGNDASVTSVETLRVPVDRIDRLLEELSDLLQSKLKLDRAAVQLADTSHDRLGRTEFLQALRSMDRKVSALRDEILRARMVTLEALFQKLERTFRETCRVTGKNGRWITVGEHVEIDKHVVERMTEPLVHLVRNAVDHGLETPQERESRAKDPVGTVRLSARSEGGFAVIEVTDDGAGLDFDAIERRAQDRAILSHAPARSELLEVIFRPGFTVRDEVTNVSGRGVGLDVVRQATLDLGGLIEAHPESIGTRFRLRIPTTLAITQALQVGIADECFFVPLDAVRRVIEVGTDRIETLGDCTWIHDGERTLQVLDFSALVRRVPATAERATRPAVVVGGSAGAFAILVDWLGARQEIVVRPLSELIPPIPAVSGSTQLGDGRTVLILDPSAFPRLMNGAGEETPR